MSDERQIELQEAHAEAAKDAAIAKVKARISRGLGAEFCECGAENHPARRAHGLSLCIDCATIKEQSKKLYHAEV